MTKLVHKSPREMSSRGLVLRLFVKSALALMAAIVVLRVVLPYLIDAHNDFALVLAFAVGVIAVASVIWFGFDFIRTIRRARAGRYGP